MYTYIPISLPFCISLPPSLSHPSRWSQSTKLISVLCGCFPLAIHFTFGSVYMSVPLSHFVPAYPSSSLCQVHSLRLRLYSCPAPRFMRTIFLKIPYICVNIQYLFFSFWLVDSSWVQLFSYFLIILWKSTLDYKRKMSDLPLCLPLFFF